MTDPRCTCGLSILDLECPVEEHRDVARAGVDLFRVRWIAFGEARERGGFRSQGAADTFARSLDGTMATVCKYDIGGEPADGGCE